MRSELWGEYNNLPIPLQQAVAHDWIERGKEGIFRGVGLVPHYGLVRMLSAEYEVSLAEFLGVTA